MGLFKKDLAPEIVKALEVLSDGHRKLVEGHNELVDALALMVKNMDAIVERLDVIEKVYMRDHKPAQVPEAPTKPKLVN